MSYNKKIFNYVIAEVEKNRQRAITVSENRKLELYKAVPQLEKIILEKNNIGLSMSKEIFSAPANSNNIIKKYKGKSIDLDNETKNILRNLKLPENFLNPPFSCNICDDTGFVETEKCQCLQKRILNEKYNRLNKISNMELKTFSDFKIEYYPESLETNPNITPRTHMRGILDFCIEYANSFSMNSKSLLMLGGTGLGKTHLSLSIAQEVIKKDYGVIYGSAPNLISKIEIEKFNRTKHDGDTLLELIECDLLILDDLGTEFQSQFTLSSIYTLVNTRLSRNLPTVISTNLSYKELENQYKERLFSRFSNFYETIAFYGSDIRRLVKNIENS